MIDHCSGNFRAEKDIFVPSLLCRAEKDIFVLGLLSGMLVMRPWVHARGAGAEILVAGGGSKRTRGHHAVYRRHPALSDAALS